MKGLLMMMLRRHRLIKLMNNYKYQNKHNCEMINE